MYLPSCQTVVGFPLWPVLIGFLVTVALGRGAKWIRNRAAGAICLELPPSVDERTRLKWKELTSGNEGGAVIGQIERSMFFVAILMDAPIVVGGWLAFKVASKWQAWTTSNAALSEFKEIDSLDAAIGRRRWSSHVLTTFLVGTGYNICAGLVGAAVARGLLQLPRLLGY